MRRHGAAVAVVGGLAALVLAAAALGARSFADPAGDNNAAPDISSVTISESPEAVLTIEVAIANYQALPTDSWLNLWIDVDNNPRTGDDGDEALIRYLDDGGLQLYRWVRSEFQRQPTTGMTGTFAEGKLTLAVPKVALDGTSNFGLIVFTSRGQEDPDGEELIASDYAPGSGRIVYGSPGPVTVSDPVGDHEAAPDVTQVDVSDTKSGVITFAVTTPSHARITGDDWLELDSTSIGAGARVEAGPRRSSGSTEVSRTSDAGARTRRTSSPLAGPASRCGARAASRPSPCRVGSWTTSRASTST